MLCTSIKKQNKKKTSTSHPVSLCTVTSHRRHVTRVWSHSGSSSRRREDPTWPPLSTDRRGVVFNSQVDSSSSTDQPESRRSHIFLEVSRPPVRHGPVRPVRAGVHPGLVRPDGGRAMQRGCGESDSQKQPEFRRAAPALLPPDIRG